DGAERVTPARVGAGNLDRGAVRIVAGGGAERGQRRHGAHGDDRAAGLAGRRRLAERGKPGAGLVEAGGDGDAVGRQACAVGLFGAIGTGEAAALKEGRDRAGDDDVVALPGQHRDLGRRWPERIDMMDAVGAGPLRGTGQQRPAEHRQRERGDDAGDAMAGASPKADWSDWAHLTRYNSRNATTNDASANVAKMPTTGIMRD